MFSERFRKVGIVVVAVALGIGTASAAIGGCANHPTSGSSSGAAAYRSSHHKHHKTADGVPLGLNSTDRASQRQYGR